MIEAEDSAAGWYPDPTGVHHQRYWAGGTWTARVADKYGSTSAHHVDGVFARPTDAPPTSATTPLSRSTLPPARVAVDNTLQGWQPDPFGRFDERYYVDGQPSQVVRTNEVEAIDPTFTTRAGNSDRRQVSSPDSGVSRNAKMIGIVIGAVVIVLLLAALKA